MRKDNETQPFKSMVTCDWSVPSSGGESPPVSSESAAMSSESGPEGAERNSSSISSLSSQSLSPVRQTVNMLENMSVTSETPLLSEDVLAQVSEPHPPARTHIQRQCSSLKRSPAIRGASDIPARRTNSTTGVENKDRERLRPSVPGTVYSDSCDKLSFSEEPLLVTCTCSFKKQAHILAEQNRKLKTALNEVMKQWESEKKATKDYVQELHKKIEVVEQATDTHQSNIDSHLARIMQEKERIKLELEQEKKRLREVQDLHAATRLQVAQIDASKQQSDMKKQQEDAERIPLLEQQISVYMDDWKSEKADKEKALEKVNELEEKVEQMQSVLQRYQDAEDAYNLVRRRNSTQREDIRRSGSYASARDDIARWSNSSFASTSGDSFRRSGSYSSAFLDCSSANPGRFVSRGTSPVVTVRCNISPRTSLYVTEDIDIDGGRVSTHVTPAGSRAASVSPRQSAVIIEDVTDQYKTEEQECTSDEDFLYCPKCTKAYPQNRHTEFVEHFEICCGE